MFRVLSSVEIGLALKNTACRCAHLVVLKVTKYLVFAMFLSPFRVASKSTHRTARAHGRESVNGIKQKLATYSLTISQ